MPEPQSTADRMLAIAVLVATLATIGVNAIAALGLINGVTPATIAELVVKQARILASAATLVKRGGRLVYATCSVLPEENEAIVDAFLAQRQDFELRDATAELARAGIALDTGPLLRLLPHRHGCDGFFAAVMERKP